MNPFNLVLLLQILLMRFVDAAYFNRTCPHKCGDVTIPYPFGTQEGCYLDKSYYIECNSTTQIPLLNTSKLVRPLESMDIQHPQVLEVRIDGEILITLPIVHSCYDNHGSVHSSSTTFVDTSRFPFSSTRNKFTTVGCDIEAHIVLRSPPVSMLCISHCEVFEDMRNGSCLGPGCCQATIPEGMTSAGIAVFASENHTKVWNYSKCGYAFIVEKDMYNFHLGDLSNLRSSVSFPLVLDWSVGNTTCEEAQKNNTTYMCLENSVCYNGEGGLMGYRCKCSNGYKGNPYIANGCQDVNECESMELNDCLPGHCKNTYGSYSCVCPKGHQGNAKRGGKCTPIERKSVIKGISEGVVGALLAMVFVYWGTKKRIRIKGRKDFFKQNGGLLLQKTLLTFKDIVNKAKIFTEDELEKATNNFNEANIIGQGGYGTVYKGILSDKTRVAIKKSKAIDQSQIKQFVNEVIILSQINHPNIVKLLGCCLETYVPLLVYEYITNNTLYHHIQIHTMLTLGTRLKIAIETANALAYMHSTTQIIHRDVKPSNILLNDDFTTKVSDFGISRFVPIGQTHLSTLVKGTIGYLDPEYFRTCKLTEKSDVYSFGVVLVELLTGEKIHSLEISLTNHRGIASYLASLLEHDALTQVLDVQLKRGENSQVVKSIARIAINCLNLEGKTRPTMRQVEEELEQLRRVLS